jgi:hypothetical protein
MMKLILAGLFSLTFGLQNFNAQAENLTQVAENMQIAAAPTAAMIKASISSVKANMMSYQTMVETYGVDWAGEYPSNLKILNKEAQNSASPYWVDTTNPFTGKMGIGLNSAAIDYSEYKKNPNHKVFAGMVLYEPLLDKKKQKILGYKIYGCDQNGLLIKEKNKVLIYSTT